jgi:hypothetical protein
MVTDDTDKSVIDRDMFLYYKDKSGIDILKLNPSWTTKYRSEINTLTGNGREMSDKIS